MQKKCGNLRTETLTVCRQQNDIHCMRFLLWLTVEEKKQNCSLIKVAIRIITKRRLFRHHPQCGYLIHHMPTFGQGNKIVLWSNNCDRAEFFLSDSSYPEFYGSNNKQGV